MATAISATGSVLCCAPISKAVARQAQHLRDRGVPPLAHTPRPTASVRTSRGIPHSRSKLGSQLSEGPSVSCNFHSSSYSKTDQYPCAAGSQVAGMLPTNFCATRSILAVYRRIAQLAGSGSIVIAVVVKNQMLKEYAQRSRTNPTMAPGRFLGAMEVRSTLDTAHPKKPRRRAILSTARSESGRRASCRRRR